MGHLYYLTFGSQKNSMDVARNKNGQFVKGSKFWEGKKRINFSGNNHFAWKGNEVGYNALHAWIKRVLGSPSFCENCKDSSRKMYHWANLSGEYKRDVSDWKRLCVRCHKNFDLRRHLNG
ncbi:MAG: hypothetical protein BWY74_02891 [Firmicutes bacterium ADurb.Bin419]|nr:MAG: hypothetical protein BWY74_02891 [Firmicutes bacterium ADurb.Bin419]